MRARLRVNADTAFGQFILAPNLPKLLSIHPKLDVELAIRSGLGDVVAVGYDFAIRFSEPDLSALIGRKILETRVLACAALSYIKRRRMPSQPSDLADDAHECIQFRNPVTHQPLRGNSRGTGARSRSPPAGG